MSRHRPFCTSAGVALAWVLLTSPASTLPMLNWIDSTDSAAANWVRSLSSTATALLLGAILILPPALGTIIGLSASARIRSAWTPMRGKGAANFAIALGLIATAAGVTIFVSWLQQR